jgi:hypothetical protein
MAEFEIIGDEHTAGGEEEMDEATRQFLEEERVCRSAHAFQDIQQNAF